MPGIRAPDRAVSPDEKTPQAAQVSRFRCSAESAASSSAPDIFSSSRIGRRTRLLPCSTRAGLKRPRIKRVGTRRRPLPEQLLHNGNAAASVNNARRRSPSFSSRKGQKARFPRHANAGNGPAFCFRRLQSPRPRMTVHMTAEYHLHPTRSSLSAPSIALLRMLRSTIGLFAAFCHIKIKPLLISAKIAPCSCGTSLFSRTT